MALGIAGKSKIPTDIVERLVPNFVGTVHDMNSFHKAPSNSWRLAKYRRSRANWCRESTNVDVGAMLIAGQRTPLSRSPRTGLTAIRISLEPMLEKFEQCRNSGSASGVMFEAHKLRSAAEQMGARRLEAACVAITKHLTSGCLTKPDTFDEELGILADHLVWETIRVQRRLHKLLSS